jgi:transketolase
MAVPQMARAADVPRLRATAARMRVEILRGFSHGKAHHFGGSFSCAEIVASLYFHRMNWSADRLDDPTRDRFIMSKGHTVPAQYAALALAGVFPVAELSTIKKLGGRLQGHPDKHKTPAIEAPTGSLGMGLSYANGMALAARLDGLESEFFVLVGDGELQEGQCWEAAMTTGHFKLTSVTVIVDRNKWQGQGRGDDIMCVEPLVDKFHSFGFDPIRIDGHDAGAVCAALDRAGRRSPRPVAIIADTVKGKGVDYMENTNKYHNAVLSTEEYRKAEEQLLAQLTAAGGPEAGYGAGR